MDTPLCLILDQLHVDGQFAGGSGLFNGDALLLPALAKGRVSIRTGQSVGVVIMALPRAPRMVRVWPACSQVNWVCQ